MPTWYPACKIRMQIRFEDFLPLPPPPAPPGVPGAQGSEAFGGGSDQYPAFSSVGLDVVPLTARVMLNSHRKADEASCSFDFRHLPFDPRIIRAATLQIFGGVFTPSEYAESVGVVGAEGLLLPDVVPQGRQFAGESNELFRGFVDEVDMTLEGADRISFRARDLTGPLLDAEIPENYLQDLPKYLPLDQVIQLLLTGDGAPTPELSRRFGLPGMRGVLVTNEVLAPGSTEDFAIIEDLPSISEIRGVQWMDSRGTARRGRRGGVQNSQKQTYWDAITDLCVGAGYIVYIRPGQTPISLGGSLQLPAAEVVISNPRTYYKTDRSGEEFVDTTKQRVFIYGANVNSVNIRRKLGGQTVPTVEVRSFNPETGERIKQRYPPLLKKKNNKPAPGQGDREEVKVFTMDEISGPGAEARCEQAARSIYEQLGRGEMELKLRTTALSGILDNLSDGIEADLLFLRPGIPLALEMGNPDIQAGELTSTNLFWNGSAEQKFEAFKAVGIPPLAAARASVALSSDAMQTTFYCSDIAWSFASDAGWEGDFTCVSYLDVRDATSSIDGVPG